MCVGVGGGVECVVGLRESVCCHGVCIFWGGGDEEYQIIEPQRKAMYVCVQETQRERVCATRHTPCGEVAMAVVETHLK